MTYLGRCIKLFVSTESTCSHEFAFQFGLAILYTREKNTQKSAETVSPARVYTAVFQWTSDRPRKGSVPAARLVASYTPNSDNLNGDNCGHSGDSLTQNGERETSQNGDNESLYIDYYSVCDVFKIFDNAI